jgi:hypothetical protein
MALDLRREALTLVGVTAATVAVFAPLFLKSPSTCIIGDMRERYAGRVPAALAEVHFDAVQMRVGLGAGAIGGWESLGEAVVLDGRAWLRTTHRASPYYYAVVFNRFFQSNALVYVPATQAASGESAVTAPVGINEWLTALAAQHPQGVLVSGYARLAPLSTIAIAQPAHESRPILNHAAAYYTRPLERYAERWVYLVALALPPTHASAARLMPPAKGAPRAGFAQALVLAAPPTDVNRAPRPGEVTALGQVVAESVIVEGRFARYPITKLAACEAARAR